MIMNCWYHWLIPMQTSSIKRSSLHKIRFLWLSLAWWTLTSTSASEKFGTICTSKPGHAGIVHSESLIDHRVGNCIRSCIEMLYGNLDACMREFWWFIKPSRALPLPPYFCRVLWTKTLSAIETLPMQSQPTNFLITDIVMRWTFNNSRLRF